MATVSHNRVFGHAGDDALEQLSADWIVPVVEPDRDAEADAALPFRTWIEAQALRYREQGQPASLWLAGQLDELAAMAKRLLADTPEKFEARMPIIDEMRDDQIRQEGWLKGYDEGFHDGERAVVNGH